MAVAGEGQEGVCCLVLIGQFPYPCARISGHLHDGMAAVWGWAYCCPFLVPKQHKAERHGVPYSPDGTRGDGNLDGKAAPGGK